MNTELTFEFWRYAPVILCAPAQTAFVLIYSIRGFGAGKWWRDYIGRALFIKSVTLDLLIVSATIAYAYNWANGVYTSITFDTDRYWKDWESLVIIGYWLVLFGVYYQLYALIRQRLSSRMEKRELDN